jgi:hypothetical protein
MKARVSWLVAHDAGASQLILPLLLCGGGAFPMAAKDPPAKCGTDGGLELRPKTC